MRSSFHVNANRIEELLQRKWIPWSILTILTLIVYSNSFFAPFHLDDFGSIVNNYSIRNPLDLMEMWKFYANRVVLYFSFSLNYAIHGSDPVGYHISNVALHIFNGILVFTILRLVLGFKCFKDTLPARYSTTLALLGALIFTVHPVQVNAVTYVVQRTASLAAMFYFLAVLFYIKFRQSDKIRYFLLTLLFTVVAMFTKENTITIPFLLAIMEFLFFTGDGRTKAWKRVLFLGILFLTVPIIPGTNLLLNGYSQSDPGVSFKASTSMDRMHYFYTQLNVIPQYMKQVLVPDRLVFDYSDDFPISATLWENYSYLSLLLLAAVAVLALVNMKRNRLLSFGIIWFFIGLSVESSFISIKDVYFEHRLYFPLAGFSMLLIGLVFMRSRKSEGISRFDRPMLFFSVIACVMIVVYGSVTLYRNYIFSDQLRMWTDVAAKAPGSSRAHSILGGNYLDAYQSRKPQRSQYLDLSAHELKKAIGLYYNNSTAHCNLSKVYLLQEKYQECIDEAIRSNNISESKYAYHNLGNGYKKLGKHDKALKAFLDGYKLDNRFTPILESLGDLYYEDGDYPNAKRYYEEYLEHNRYYSEKAIKEKLEKIEKGQAPVNSTANPQPVTQ